MSEQILQTNLSETTAAADSNETSLKTLPAFLGFVFFIYLILSFFLMESIELNTQNPGIQSLMSEFHISSLHTVFFRYSIIGCIVVPFIFLIEWLCVGWIRSSLHSVVSSKNLSGRSDTVCFILAHLRLLRIPQIIFTFGFAAISGSMVSEIAYRYLFPDLIKIKIPAYIAYPLYFFLYTGFDYLAHRVDHSRYFWPLHRFHHAAEEFNVFTADRGHPASAFTQSSLKIFPLALLGVPPGALIDIGMLIVVINYLNHSRIDWDFGWFGRHVIQSPLHHQLHHIRGRRWPCNLSICPIWDRLGGTWMEITTASIPLGTSKPYRHGFNVVPDLLRDYQDFLRGFVRGARKLRRRVTSAKMPPTLRPSGSEGTGGPLPTVPVDGPAEIRSA